MSNLQSPRPKHPLGFYEEKVLEAFKELPTQFTIEANARLPLPGGEINYEPDFVIQRHDGQQLLVEVKSVQSLSISNLSRLTRISELIRKAGKGFVVLALDPGFGRPAKRNIEAFKKLHIHNVKTNSEIVDATLEEFKEL